jgi:hypothetical protein
MKIILSVVILLGVLGTTYYFYNRYRENSTWTLICKEILNGDEKCQKAPKVLDNYPSSRECMQAGAVKFPSKVGGGFECGKNCRILANVYTCDEFMSAVQ